MESQQQSNTVKVKLFDERTPPNDTVFVLGSTGCGKTTLIANLLLQRQTFVIIDVKDEYPANFFHAKTCYSLRAFAESLNKGEAKIILRTSAAEVDINDFVSLACSQLMDFQRVNKNRYCTFAMDEMNQFVTPNSSPQGLQDIIQRGRGLYLSKIFGAQWFNSCPTWARDSFSEMYVFRHNEKRGLEMLEEYGFERDTVRNLPMHTCLHLKGNQIKRESLVPA